MVPVVPTKTRLESSIKKLKPPFDLQADFFTAKVRKGADDRMEKFFGLERFIAKEGIAYTAPGTPTWLCPECSRGKYIM